MIWIYRQYAKLCKLVGVTVKQKFLISELTDKQLVRAYCQLRDLASDPEQEKLYQSCQPELHALEAEIKRRITRYCRAACGFGAFVLASGLANIIDIWRRESRFCTQPCSQVLGTAVLSVLWLLLAVMMAFAIYNEHWLVKRLRRKGIRIGRAENCVRSGKQHSA
jgi:hypothetical protein